MMMSVDQSVECLTEETEELGENVPNVHFVHHKSHKNSPELEHCQTRWEAGD
jgi:hypothetical protein